MCVFSSTGTGAIVEVMEPNQTIRFLYGEVFSATTAPDLASRLARVLAPAWESIGDYSGAKKTRDQFTAQLTGFGKLIPDLTWKIEELIEAGNRVIVRGRASGTPVGELFGVPAGGKKFEIMSIDIHTLEAGMIVRTHHVEDWAGALRQLK
jgi:predicted ester cyclase